MADDDGFSRFDELAAHFETLPDVAMNRMFGTVGLGVRGKVFAFMASSGALALKVGVDTADELEAAAIATRMQMRGRIMREWVAVSTERMDQWPELMERARVFLDEITPR